MYRLSFQHCRHLLAYVLLILSFLVLVACSSGSYPTDYEQLSEEERIVIRFSHIVGEQTPKGLAARQFAKLMKERTNGYVEVQVFPNGYLYKDGEEMEALLKGDIQMIAPATSKVTSLVPEWQVMDLPFAFDSVEEVHQYMDSELGHELINKLEQKGLYTLQIWDNGFKQMTSLKRPLRIPADFEGMHFRIMPSQVINEQFQVLQAKTQFNSFNEVFQLLENKQINAQENTFSNIVSKNLHSLQDYVTISNHGYLGYLVLMNKEFWDKLPVEIQLLIQQTLDEVTEWEIELAKEMNQENLQDLEECQCVEIHVLTHEEKQLWEEALQPVYDSFRERFGAKYIENLPKFKQE